MVPREAVGDNNPMLIRMVDRTPGGVSEARDWDAPVARITLRELIAERVRGEVADYNRAAPEVYRGLVAPEESERILNGYRLARRRELDPEREVDRAYRAFEGNGFVVFAGGRQIDSLDEELEL